MRFITLLLLLVVSLSQAQMKITDHAAEQFADKTITYRLYLADPPSSNYLIFGHGSGEVGPADGSNLPALEKNSGYPKFALGIRPGQVKVTGTTNYPFNIIAIQADKNYDNYKKFILYWVKYRFNPHKVGITGLSLGGMFTYDVWARDTLDNILCFVAPVCGRGNTLNIPKVNPLPYNAWHGMLDTEVAFSADQSYYKAYNAMYPSLTIWHPIPGVGHNAWDYAYKDSGLLQWMIQIFGDNPLESKSDYTKGYLDALNQMKIEADSLINQNK